MAKVTMIPLPAGADSVSPLIEATGEAWTPLFHHECTFPPEIFRQVMLNLIRNPNINSNHLFRADISLDVPLEDEYERFRAEIPPRITHFRNFTLKTVMVRTMIPRNTVVDKPLDQTCLFYERIDESGDIWSLVSYLPHVSAAEESPFYHPAVRGIGFLHSYNPDTKTGTVSIHYAFFNSEPRSEKLERTAQHLLAVLHKHGQGTAAGYIKRVQHDVILPQATVQDTYARLKAKYGKILCQRWVESTDPTKHVFEDLGIAAFLIELWKEMYVGERFPGFVDIGCGNGLLVHLLVSEGYSGWGFDARRRKSWATWNPDAQEVLKELLLIPAVIQKETKDTPTTNLNTENNTSDQGHTRNEETQNKIHDGVFPEGTFIISNHADELTPWTPILANLSKSPFMMIPCCSHNLTGAKFRAPSVKKADIPSSAFASLCAWVSNIASDCGWEVEKEMLRIPSTRNTSLIGRRRNVDFENVQVDGVIQKYGGAAGFETNTLKLLSGILRGH